MKEIRMIRRSTLYQFTTRLTLFITLIGAIALIGGRVAAAVVQPDLGTAVNFAVLAGTTVTNTGATVIGPAVGAPVFGGDLGVSPGGAVVGFPPGIVLAPGVIHAADPVSLQ